VKPTKLVLIPALALLAGTAHAHIVLEQKSATAASYYKATFMVGHGCAGSATTGISISIPAGVVNVKPMPKSGWQVQTRVETLWEEIPAEGKTTRDYKSPAALLDVIPTAENRH
jgi:uncharacterized protein YcnI